MYMMCHVHSCSLFHSSSAVYLHICVICASDLCLRSVPASRTYALPKAKTLGMMQSQRRTPANQADIHNFSQILLSHGQDLVENTLSNAMVTRKCRHFTHQEESEMEAALKHKKVLASISSAIDTLCRIAFETLS